MEIIIQLFRSLTCNSLQLATGLSYLPLPSGEGRFIFLVQPVFVWVSSRAI